MDSSNKLYSAKSKSKNCYMLLQVPHNTHGCPRSQQLEEIWKSLPLTQKGKYHPFLQQMETSSSHKDTSSSHKDTSSSHKDTSSSHTDTSSSHTDTSSSHTDTSSSHTDTSSSHTDTSSSHTDTSSSHTDTSSSHRRQKLSTKKTEGGATKEGLTRWEGYKEGEATRIGMLQGGKATRWEGYKEGDATRRRMLQGRGAPGSLMME
ncbi:hypothetical protein FHG87_004861 [Trinorchestia longiramus]|nr:hypothetical protein FHG87_004861 [Trinorchestia longiramus]